ncbi:MAG: Mu-like prophage major head subunit gpT family protein [bacterium]
MIINQANLTTLYTGFRTIFNRALGAADSMWPSLATQVPSSTREEKYGWLGKIPNIREWVGDRVVHGLMAHDYAIKNLPYELTIAVDRDDIEDDQFGVYNPMFEELGESVGVFPDEKVFQLLKDGFSTPGYDGQFFFDTDHPVLDENGDTISVANTDGGAGAEWFLADLSRAVKPIIVQNRRPFNLVALDRPNDPNVFFKKEFVYGVDGRKGFGYGLWQPIWGSKQTLDKTNYGTAREALLAMKGDYGRKLGFRRFTLICGPSNEKAALEILNAERDSAGATNVYKDTAQLMVTPYLD